MKPKLDNLYTNHRLKVRPELHVMLGYDKTVKTWKFLGYSCPICLQSLKTVYVATKHKCTPTKMRNHQRKNDIESDTIITVSGKPFSIIKP